MKDDATNRDAPASSVQRMVRPHVRIFGTEYPVMRELEGNWKLIAHPNGKEWRFDFDEYGGPLWLRKDGEPRKCQNPNKAVWRRWEGWHKRWRAEKAKSPSVWGKTFNLFENMGWHEAFWDDERKTWTRANDQTELRTVTHWMNGPKAPK